MRYVLLINSDKMEPIHLLASDPEVHLSVITKPKYAALYEGIAEIWPVDDVANLLQAASSALKMLQHHPIDGIVTPLERSLPTGGYLRSYLDLPGPGYDQVAHFANKRVMKRCLKQAGLPLTTFEPLDRLEQLPAIGDRLGWPVVAKPAISSGSMNTFIIQSAAHFYEMYDDGQLRKLEQVGVPMLAEHYVPLEAEYHCDSVVYKGQVVFAAVSLYFQSMLDGVGDFNGSYILPEDDPALNPILELNQAALTALGLETGVTHTEFFKTPTGFIFGETTCRPGGAGIAKAIKLQFDVDIWKAYVYSCLGDAPCLTPLRKPGVYGWYGLPGQNGRISRLTSKETLARIPGIVNVKMIYQVGDQVQEKITSVFYNVMLHFHRHRVQDLPDMVRSINAAYQVEIEP